MSGFLSAHFVFFLFFSNYDWDEKSTLARASVCKGERERERMGERERARERDGGENATNDREACERWGGGEGHVFFSFLRNLIRGTEKEIRRRNGLDLIIIIIVAVAVVIPYSVVALFFLGVSEVVFSKVVMLTYLVFNLALACSGLWYLGCAHITPARVCNHFAPQGTP